jgi:hypothetical protein
VFHGWDNYYLLIGGAAGAIIGLLFIVSTLRTNIDRDRALAGSSVYMTPVVAHLSIVLSISALASAPGIAAPLAAAGVGLCAVIGVICQVRVGWLLRNGKFFQNAHWSDLWWYGVWPGVIYLALGASGAALCFAPWAATYGVAASLLALMLISIHNAWDLVTWISATHNQSS